MLYFGRKLRIGFLFFVSGCLGRPFHVSGSLKSCRYRAAVGVPQQNGGNYGQTR
nr:MAG TPA: hypothetical protein [Caudoviricetes sp.]